MKPLWESRLHPSFPAKYQQISFVSTFSNAFHSIRPLDVRPTRTVVFVLSLKKALDMLKEFNRWNVTGIGGEAIPPKGRLPLVKFLVEGAAFMKTLRRSDAWNLVP